LAIALTGSPFTLTAAACWENVKANKPAIRKTEKRELAMGITKGLKEGLIVAQNRPGFVCRRLNAFKSGSNYRDRQLAFSKINKGVKQRVESLRRHCLLANGLFRDFLGRFFRNFLGGLLGRFLRDFLGRLFSSFLHGGLCIGINNFLCRFFRA
jgi:hypothetical protein